MSSLIGITVTEGAADAVGRGIEGFCGDLALPRAGPSIAPADVTNSVLQAAARPFMLRSVRVKKP
jgi:hypothetical protein